MIKLLDMPDGDIFIANLRIQYQKPYKMLCEQRFSLHELEKAVLRAIHNRIKKAGIKTIDLIEIMAGAINQALGIDALSKDERCKLANKAIDEVRYNSTLAPHWCDLISNAAKNYIHDIRYGILGTIGYENEQIMKRFYNDS
jgi:hypothetical protein